MFLSQLDALEIFLKFKMLQHNSEDTDPLYYPYVALFTYLDDGDKVSSQCMAFTSPFKVLDDIMKRASSEREDIFEFLGDAEEKLSLYIGHKTLCYNK